MSERPPRSQAPMQSHEGLFDKLKLGPKYTRHSGVGTWTLRLVKAGVFMGHYKRLAGVGGEVSDFSAVS